jgi:Fic family protein
MRVVSGYVGREIAHFEAPSADRIPTEIAHFLEWWNESRDHLEGLLRSAIAQFWFVTIHPFEDGKLRFELAGLAGRAIREESNRF